MTNNIRNECRAVYFFVSECKNKSVCVCVCEWACVWGCRSVSGCSGRGFQHLHNNPSFPLCYSLGPLILICPRLFLLGTPSSTTSLYPRTFCTPQVGIIPPPDVFNAEIIVSRVKCLSSQSFGFFVGTIKTRAIFLKLNIYE